MSLLFLNKGSNCGTEAPSTCYLYWSAASCSRSALHYEAIHVTSSALTCHQLFSLDELQEGHPTH